jgi:hypothetical protein
MAMRDVSQHSLTMLFCIAIVGGLTLMMGQHARSESLFYYFRLDDQVPENHLLRLVDRHIDFGFVRERLKDSYSDTGRPSIDPELLLRILWPHASQLGWCAETSYRSMELSLRQTLPRRAAFRESS